MTLAIQFGVVGRLYAIRCALDYDLRPLRALGHDPSVPAPAWNANMRAWRIAGGGER